MAPMRGKVEVGRSVRSRESLSQTAGGSSSSGSNRIWSRVISTFALAVLAGALAACGVGFAGGQGRTGYVPVDQKNGPDRTGRALLVGDQDEPAGYGLYSYVLFESRPNAETEPVYLAIISACLKEVPDLDGLKKKYPNTKSLNAMFIPVKVFTPEQSEHTQLKLMAKKILAEYNYDRAQTILHRLSKIYRNGGPYLVSSLDRVSSTSRISPSLFQDLSAVRLVSNQDDWTKMAYEWVLDFVDRVSNPQSTGWDDATLATFSDKIREKMEPAFASYGVRADQLDLKKYIVFPIPDNQAKRIFPFPSWKPGVDDGGPNLITVQDQLHSVPRPVSFPSQPAPVRQRGDACDGRCRVH